MGTICQAEFWIRHRMKCVKVRDHNPWCEYIAEMMLKESSHTVLSEAQGVQWSFKLACRYKEQAEE